MKITTIASFYTCVYFKSPRCWITLWFIRSYVRWMMSARWANCFDLNLDCISVGICSWDLRFSFNYFILDLRRYFLRGAIEYYVAETPAYCTVLQYHSYNRKTLASFFYILYYVLQTWDPPYNGKKVINNLLFICCSLAELLFRNMRADRSEEYNRKWPRNSLESAFPFTHVVWSLRVHTFFFKLSSQAHINW